MLLFALASGICWTFFDFSRRYLGERVSASVGAFAVVLVQFLISVPFSQLVDWQGHSPSWWGYCLLSILLNTLASVFFLSAVQRAPFTLVVPLLSLTPAVAALIGISNVFVSHSEAALTSRQILAVIVIVGAAVFLGFRGEGRKLNAREFSGIYFMLATMVCWATTPFLDRIVNQQESISLPGYISLQCLGIAIMLLFWILMSQDGRSELKTDFQIKGFKRWFGFALAAALTSSFALGFQIQGTFLGAVGIFEAYKRAFAILVSMILGRYFLKENITVQKIAAAVGLALGLFLLNT